MKDIISRLLWKLQQLITKKLFELILWSMVAGTISVFISYYILYNYSNNIYNTIIVNILSYYACYKIILDN
jgi:ABC-type Mn2+/Zn2+ transport system permease subunit